MIVSCSDRLPTSARLPWQLLDLGQVGLETQADHIVCLCENGIQNGLGIRSRNRRCQEFLPFGDGTGTDTDLLRTTLLSGLGPAKRYGCGLLTLAPLTETGSDG